MALSLLPASAFAVEPANSGIATQSNDVAQVIAADGSTLIGSYPAFDNAYNAAKDIPNCTLKLLKDVTIYNSYQISNFTLDGTGHTISPYSFYSLSLENNAKITGGIFNAIVVLCSGAKLSGGSYTSLTLRGITWNDALESGHKFYKGGTPLTEADLSKRSLQDVEVKPYSGSTDPIYAAQIGDTKYETLNEAIAAAKADDKVELRFYVTEDVTIGKAITLDLSRYGITGTVTITNADARLTTTAAIKNSGTITNLKITAAGKTLLDVLENGFAYYGQTGVTSGTVYELGNVQIWTHTCYFGNSTTCACGRVKNTTPPVITLDSSTICGQGTEGNVEYVEVKGNTLTFTITDDSAVKSVKINGESVNLSSDDTYSIEIDDERSEVDDNRKRGYQPVRIIAEDTAGNSIERYFIAYRMVETKITQVPEGIKILSICGDPVTTDTGKTADASRWRRAASPYCVEFQVEDQPWFNAAQYLKLYLFHTGSPDYTARYEFSCKKTSNGNYLFTTVVGNEVNADSHLATALKKNRENFSYGQLQNIHIVRAKDQTAPATTISFKGKEYKSFTTINQTTVYELFYKDSLTVNVTATDDNSGVASAKYLFTETKYTETQLQNATDWQTFSLTASAEDPATYTGRFTLNAGKLGTKGFLYVRTKDNANNTTNVSANKGLVIYKDAVGTNTTITKDLYEVRTSPVPLPVNSGSSANKVVITCTDSSGNKTTLRPFGVPAIPYDVHENGNVSLTQYFLKDLTVGTYTLEITIDPVGEKYKEADGNDKPTTVTVTLNVTKIKPTFTADNIPLSDKDFDGSAVNHPTIAPSITGGRNVRYEYKVKDADDNTYTTTPPTTAGDYVVKVTIEGDESYEAVTATKNFTISPKEVTITGTTVSNKVYNGNTDAVIANLGTLNGIVDSHNKVTIKDGSATFNNKNVGENKTVTFSGFTLEGADAKNYTLTAQPAAATASITPRLVTINGLAVDNKTYDGKPDATLSADLTLTLAPVANNADSGIVPNDDVTLNPTAAKAEFENKNAGADKPVTFSDFALTGADAGNYTLVLPTDVTATIERKTLTVDGLKIADKTYDGTKTAQWDGTPTLIGLVEGETLQLICGVPTFTSAIPGSNIPVTFTPFSLADGTGLAANYTLIQPVSGSITGNIVVNRHNHSRGPRPYLPQQPANGANGTNGGKDGVTSARTGDMGVALYAALSLASLSGTALLTRKRKETL